MSVSAVPNVRRLAQYRPFERGGLDLRAVLGDLVLAVAAISDGAIESLMGLRAAFGDLWGLEVEVDELRPVLEEFAEAGVVTRVSRGYRLSSSVLSELQAKALEWQELEDRAFRDWELSVRQRKPGISDDEMDLLRADLRDWLHMIITRHGAEAALILYPEDDRAHRFFDDVDARGFDLLPEREPELHALRAGALPLFIRCPTADQRRFLALLLNTSFYMTVLTIDPAAEQLVRTQIEGSRVYLDTNFLYAVLGAAPPDEVYSSRRLIQMSKELGFEFAVTPWTLSELRTSIARSRREIDNQQRFVRPELAETMLRTSGDKGFNRLFWQTYKDKKTQPKDVFDRLEQFERDLARYGIVEVAEGCTAVEQQEERIRLYASLVGAERWPHQKEPVVLEHDAKCRLLVERLRGEGNLTLSNARYWFLTYDTKLPRFAQRVPDNGDEAPDLPFCISPSAWVQITRALTPRTEDFDRTVVDLLTSPFVGYRLAVNSSVVQEVVGRMDHFEDASPEMAVAVLTDTAKVSEIQRAVSTQDEDAVEEAVSVAYSSMAREMQEAVAASEQRVVDIENALREAETRAAEGEAARLRDLETTEKTHKGERDAEEAARQLELEREAWEDEKRALEKSAAESERARDKADQRIAALEARSQEDDERRRRIRRVGAGLLLIAVGFALAAILSLLIFDDGWAVGAAVLGGVALALVGVRMIAGKEWGGEIVTWGGLFVAVAAIVVAVIVGAD